MSFKSDLREKRPKAWQRLSTKLLQKTVVFDLFVQRLKSPRNGVEDDFYYIDVVDWVNIIALTPAGEVVMVNQYRFGIHDVSLELPGGMLDPGETNLEAAVLRELREETGYEADEVESLGFVHPNPAMQTNRCHFFFAKNVRPVSEQSLDTLEDIQVLLLPLAELREQIENHTITHSLMVTAFFRLLSRSEGFDEFLAKSAGLS